MFHMMAALAEFERSIISEPTRAGMAAAHKRGKRLGRPRALSEQQLRQTRCSIGCKRIRHEDVARELNASRTLRRHLTADGHIQTCADCRPCYGPTLTEFRVSALDLNRAVAAVAAHARSVAP